MGESRIDKALARIDTAMARVEIAQRDMLARTAENSSNNGHGDQAASARVMELVNRHEQLREEVAESLRDLDSLIEELEG